MLQIYVLLLFNALSQAILVTPTGWANAATIDVIYDLLHMMGRDDIIVGLGDSFGLNQSYPNDPSVGNCKYSKAIPHGSGGLLDSDTLFGLARDLPRSPRRYFYSHLHFYSEKVYVCFIEEARWTKTGYVLLTIMHNCTG